ncbi:MAG: hypothetical protein BWY68_00091 [bacterium ADurb.Bin400]|nr:MAG: hypothetical protein BWY68_00091 [bacterium ADurb.Bin400]
MVYPPAGTGFSTEGAGVSWRTTGGAGVASLRGTAADGFIGRPSESNKVAALSSICPRTGSVARNRNTAINAPTLMVSSFCRSKRRTMLAPQWRKELKWRDTTPRAQDIQTLYTLRPRSSITAYHISQEMRHYVTWHFAGGGGTYVPAFAGCHATHYRIAGQRFRSATLRCIIRRRRRGDLRFTRR